MIVSHLRLLPLLLVLLVVLAACHSASTGHISVDASLASFLPGDATMLAGVRMDAVRPTPLYQKLMAGRTIEPLDELAGDARDLLLTSDGQEILIASRGTFNQRSLAGWAKQPYKGQTLYTSGNRAVVLIGSATALAGTLSAVKAAVDRQDSGNRSGPADLLARAQLIPAENQVWSVSNGFETPFTSRLPDTGNAANAARVLRSLDHAIFSADLRAGIRGSLTGTCATELDAKNLGDTVRGLVGLGRLSVPQNKPELLRVWDGIQVDQHESTVTITVNLPEDLVEKTLDALGGLPQLRHLPISVPASRLPFSAPGSRRPG